MKSKYGDRIGVCGLTCVCNKENRGKYILTVGAIHREHREI